MNKSTNENAQINIQDNSISKSLEASTVLQLMDENCSYQEALNVVVEAFDVTDVERLKKELTIYI